MKCPQPDCEDQEASQDPFAGAESGRFLVANQIQEQPGRAAELAVAHGNECGEHQADCGDDERCNACTGDDPGIEGFQAGEIQRQVQERGTVRQGSMS